MLRCFTTDIINFSQSRQLWREKHSAARCIGKKNKTKPKTTCSCCFRLCVVRSMNVNVTIIIFYLEKTLFFTGSKSIWHHNSHSKFISSSSVLNGCVGSWFYIVHTIYHLLELLTTVLIAFTAPVLWRSNLSNLCSMFSTGCQQGSCTAWGRSSEPEGEASRVACHSEWLFIARGHLNYFLEWIINSLQYMSAHASLH